jgi:transcriptional regulator with XRE-family HTH domain
MKENMKFDLFKTPNEINMGIVQRVKLRRKEKRITQKKLSELADVSLGSIKRFERTGEIALVSLIKIAFVLDCSEDFEELFAKKTYASIDEVIHGKN